jgi:hypothetical protein
VSEHERQQPSAPSSDTDSAVTAGSFGGGSDLIQIAAAIGNRAFAAAVAAGSPPPPSGPNAVILRATRPRIPEAAAGPRRAAAATALLQRQPAGGGGASADVKEWVKLLPDAPAGTKVQVVPGAGGKDPHVEVTAPGQAPGGTPATPAGDDAATKEAQERAAKIDSVCGQIAANRGGIQERFMTRMTATIKKQTGQFGFMYTPQQEKFAKDATAAQKGAANDYLAWLAGAQPTAVSSAGAGLSGKLKAQFELWQDIGSEGAPAAMNTWDGENVTFGRGFSGSGQLQTMMADLFKADPAAQDEFLQAGIALESGQFVLADVERKFKHHGDDAEHIIQVDRKLVSLFVNVAESPAHRQAVLDANWRQFVKGTGNIPDFAVAWDRRPRAVAGHNVHAGGFSWGEFAGTGGTMKAVVIHIADKVKDKQVSRDKITVVSAGTTKARFLDLAKGYAKDVLGSPQALFKVNMWQNPAWHPGEEGDVSPFNVSVEQGSFEAGKVYFGAGGETYYILQR